MEYQVIEIIDEYNLLIDYGIEDGAEQGLKVSILYIGEDVIHPITKEIIGTMDFVKEYLEIVTVYPKFSLCRKLKKSSTLSSMASMSPLNKYSVEEIPISVDAKQISHRKMEFDKKIQIGDKAIILD